MFSFGYMFLSALSYWYRDWRDFTMAIGLISAPFVLTAVLWPESPRWLYLKERFKYLCPCYYAPLSETFVKISPQKHLM